MMLAAKKKKKKHLSLYGRSPLGTQNISDEVETPLETRAAIPSIQFKLKRFALGRRGGGRAETAGSSAGTAHFVACTAQA